MKLPDEEIAEKYRIGILLSLVGGFLDVYTYITRGHVFANAETGNMVLMGIAIAKGELYMAISYLIPILAFALGVIIVELVKHHFRVRGQIHYRHIIIVIKIIIITIVAFIPSGNLNIAVNSAISLISSMQMQAYRRIRGNPFATTMCTGNLRSLGDNLSNYLYTNEKKYLKNTIAYLLIIFIFILGSAIGYYLTNIFNEKSILFCNILLITCFIILLKEDQ